MKTKTKSKVFFRDGKVLEYAVQIAYQLWLAGGVALRVAGDTRPVQPWEYAEGSAYLD